MKTYPPFPGTLSESGSRISAVRIVKKRFPVERGDFIRKVSSRLSAWFRLGLALSGPAATVSAQEFRTFIGASGTLWESPTNWNPNLVPDSITEGARVEVGNVQLGSNLVIGALEFNGTGGVNLNQSNELRTSSLVHSGGTVSGTGQLTVTSAGTISSVSGVLFTGCTFRSEGNLVIGNTADFQGGAIFENVGQTELVDNARLTASSVPNTSLIENTGFLRKLAGPGRATLSIPVDNDNTIACNAGTFRVEGGGSCTGLFITGPEGIIDIRGLDFTMLDGAAVTGDGETILISNFDIPAGNAITLDHFTLDGLGSLRGAGEVEFLGTGCRLEDGSLAGTLVSTVGSGAVLPVVTDGGTTIEDTHELRVLSGGKLLLSDSTSRFVSNGNGTLRNRGIVEFADDGDIVQNGVTASTLMRLVNEAGGTVLKSGESGGVTQVVSEVESAGTWQLDAGKMEIFRDSNFSGPIVANAGTLLEIEQPTTWNAGTSLRGDGVIALRHTATVPAGVTVAAENLRMEGSGSRFGGDGTLRIDDVFHWQGGGPSGAVTLDVIPGAELVVETATGKEFGAGSTATILNRGTARFFDNGSLSSNGSGTIDNRGLMDLASDFDITVNSGTPTVLLNSGTLRKTAGNGGDSLLRVDLTHSGVFDVQAGYLRLQGNHDLQAPVTVQPGARLRFESGSSTLRAGSGFSGGGAFEHSTGTIEVEGGARVEVSGYDPLGSGARIGGAGTFVLEQSGPLSSLLHSGPGVTEIPAGRTINAGSFFDLDEERTLRVLGTLELPTSFNATASNGVTLDIQGLLDITTGMNLGHGGGVYTIHNNGVIRSRAPGTSFANLAPDIYTGSGLLSVETGRLRLGRAVTLSGMIEVHAGAQLLSSQTVTFGPGSTLGGDGLVQGNPVFAGTVSPGMSIGTLEISGNPDFQGGTLLVEVGDVGASDLLDVSGTVDLSGGKLRVMPAIGFSPTAGESWTVLEAAGITGTFDTIVQPAASGGFGYFVTYNATSVVVTYSAIDSFRKAYEAAAGVTLGPDDDLAAIATGNLDGDELPNLLDWAFGGSLSAPDPGRGLVLESVTPGDPRVVALRYPSHPLATDVILKITGDDDLAGPFELKTFTPSGAAVIDGILFQQGTLSLPAGDPSRFFRVEATLDLP